MESGSGPESTTKPPFEDVTTIHMTKPPRTWETVDIKFATWKTAFLVMLASGARASEIHSIEANSLRFQEKYRYAVMEPVPEFKAKTANKNAKSQRLEIIKVQALGPYVDTKDGNCAQSEPSRHTGQRLRKPGKTMTPEDCSSPYKGREKVT